MTSRRTKQLTSIIVLLSINAMLAGCGAAVESESTDTQTSQTTENTSTDTPTLNQVTFGGKSTPNLKPTLTEHNASALTIQLLQESSHKNKSEQSTQSTTQSTPSTVETPPAETTQISAKPINTNQLAPIEIVETTENIELTKPTLQTVEVISTPISEKTEIIEIVETPPQEQEPQQQEEVDLIDKLKDDKSLQEIGDFRLDEQKEEEFAHNIQPETKEPSVEELSITTEEFVPVTLGSVLLGWDSHFTFDTGETLKTTDIDGFEIAYGHHPNSLTQTIAINDPSATEYRIADLSPGALYFAVRVITKSGQASPYSNHVFAAVE